jgi:NitT/TauT family transport system substrate-binding protein
MTKLQMRRRAILAATPALVAGAVAAPYVARAQTGKPEKTKVVLAVGGKSALYYLSLTIAETKGYFKEAGLDVEINDFQGGAKSLQALMGGSADVVAGAYEHTIRMQQRGQPIVGFALIGRGMQLAIALRKDVAAKVKGPADIKGMKFGVTAPGSQTHMLVNNWAAKGGLKPTDIVAIGVGAGASVVAAIEKGEVDGISQADPALTILQEKGLIKIMVDTRTMKGNQELFGGSMPAACLYAQPDLLKKTPGTAQALATAIVRADQWLQTASPADVAKAVPEAYLLGDKAIYEKAFANVRDTISPDGVMPPDGPPNCLKFLAEGDPKIVPAQIKLADTWTNEFAQRAGKRS